MPMYESGGITMFVDPRDEPRFARAGWKKLEEDDSEKKGDQDDSEKKETGKAGR